jgi:hypothetical protein
VAWEEIGSLGEGQMPGERAWIAACQEFAMAYLQQVCGQPPKGYKLEVIWQDYESLTAMTQYPTIAVTWGEGMYGGTLDAPWGYIEKCQVALEALEDALDWEAIEPANVQEQFSGEEEE